MRRRTRVRFPPPPPRGPSEMPGPMLAKRPVAAADSGDHRPSSYVGVVARTGRDRRPLALRATWAAGLGELHVVMLGLATIGVGGADQVMPRPWAGDREDPARRMQAAEDEAAGP